MKRTGFTENQIAMILMSHKAGINTGDLCRELFTGLAVFYNWKAHNRVKNKFTDQL